MAAWAASAASSSGSGLPSSANGPWRSVARVALAPWRPAPVPSTAPPFHSTASVVAAISSSAWDSTPSTQRRTFPSGVVSLAIWWAR